MWFRMREVGLDFLATAKRRYVVEAEVGAPRMDVWRTLVDPTTWPRWWPGVRSASYGEQAGPPGIGTFRRATVGRQTYEEYIVAWDEGERWAYYIDRATLPIATAQLECTELADSSAGTRVRWTLAQDPRLLMVLTAPLFPRLMRSLFERAMSGLELYLKSRSGER
jgi:uncharacterized protein YndB with AHSA1/START domain